MNIEIVERPPTKREARKQDRRRAIIDAARRSFLSDGYAATSMSGLLTTLGGSKATLWSYFRSKEDLFAAVIDDLTSAFRAQLESGLSGLADLETTLAAFCRGFLNRIADPDTVLAWRLIVGESGRFPELGRIFHEKGAQPIERTLADYLSAQIAMGRLRDEDPRQMAQLLLGLFGPQHNMHLWGIASASADEMDDDADRFVGYFIRLFGLPQ